MVKIMRAPKSYSLYYNNKQSKIISYLSNVFLILGLYFGFFEVKGRTKSFLKLIAVLQSILLISYCLHFIYFHAFSDIYWFPFFFLQHLIYSIQLTRIKEGSTLHNIIQDLRVIDIGLKVWNESYHIDIKLLASYTLLLTYRLTITYFFGIHKSITGSLPFFLVFVALDVVRFIYTFMFYAINWRLKKLGKLLKNENPDVMTMQFLYKSIVDIAEKYKNDYNIILVVSLIINVPQSMLLTYKTLLMIQDLFTWNLIFHIYVRIIELMSLTLIPAIVAGMLAIEADKIKMKLYNLLLESRDEASYDEISRFIQYIETRGCRFRVCYILPLDADMLGTVLSLYVTYIIVIVQFIFK